MKNQDYQEFFLTVFNNKKAVIIFIYKKKFLSHVYTSRKKE